MRLACDSCWEKKRALGGDIFDVETEHSFDFETKIATCKICGNKQRLKEKLRINDE